MENHAFETVCPATVLLMLSLRDAPAAPSVVVPSWALLSRKLAQSSAMDSLSLAWMGSEKTSALKDGELGVL